MKNKDSQTSAYDMNLNTKIQNKKLSMQIDSIRLIKTRNRNIISF